MPSDPKTHLGVAVDRMPHAVGELSGPLRVSQRAGQALLIRADPKSWRRAVPAVVMKSSNSISPATVTRLALPEELVAAHMEGYNSVGPQPDVCWRTAWT